MRYLISFLSFLAAAPLTTSAQTVKPLIDTQNYVFVAQSAQPLAGSERPLTENVYYVKITKEKIVSYLPYSGNSRIASTDAVTNALDFTSSKFTYKVIPLKRGGWKVLIRPKDAGYLDEIQLTIRPDGAAVALATFNGMDNIGFSGTVADPSVLPTQ